MANTTPSIDALRLAAAAGCDPRTAARALREGIEVIRGAYTRDRLGRAMRELGMATEGARATG